MLTADAGPPTKHASSKKFPHWDEFETRELAEGLVKSEPSRLQDCIDMEGRMTGHWRKFGWKHHLNTTENYNSKKTWIYSFSIHLNSFNYQFEPRNVILHAILLVIEHIFMWRGAFCGRHYFARRVAAPGVCVANQRPDRSWRTFASKSIAMEVKSLLMWRKSLCASST